MGPEADAAAETQNPVIEGICYFEDKPLPLDGLFVDQQPEPQVVATEVPQDPDRKRCLPTTCAAIGAGVAVLLSVLAAGAEAPTASAKSGSQATAHKFAKLPGLKTTKPISIDVAQKRYKAKFRRKPGVVIENIMDKTFEDSPKIKGIKFNVRRWVKLVENTDTKKKDDYKHKPLKDGSLQRINDKKIYLQTIPVKEAADLTQGPPAQAVPNTPPPNFTQISPVLAPPVETAPAAVGTNPGPDPEVPPSFDTNIEKQKREDADALYIPFLNGCSGTYIRDSQGNAIGAVGAAHCGPRTATRTVGTDGKTYMVTDGVEPRVYPGKDVNNMPVSSLVERIMVAPTNDPNYDLFVMVFKGKEPGQVIENLNNSLIKDNQIALFSAEARKGLFTAYPITSTTYSPPGGIITRQTIEFTAVGQVDRAVSNGMTIRGAFVAGVKSLPGKPMCSGGSSGASGGIYPDGQNVSWPNLVRTSGGALAAMDNLTGVSGGQLRARREQEMGRSLAEFDGLCYLDKNLSPNAEEVWVVTNRTHVP